MIRSIAALLLLLAAPGWGADLSGKWDFDWFTEAGLREAVVEFSQDGEKLLVNMGGVEFSGSVDGDEFEFSGELYSPDAGYTSTLKAQGKLTEGKLRGDGKWDTYAVTFAATKAD